jgi:hypothetical protein
MRVSIVLHRVIGNITIRFLISIEPTLAGVNKFRFSILANLVLP